jgi:hypothetical protein
MRSSDYQSAAVILAYLDHQRAPDPNPGTARELDALVPEMAATIGDDSLRHADQRASSLDQEEVTQLAIDALSAVNQD